MDVTGDVQSFDIDIYHLVMPVTVGDEQSSTCIIQIEKLDELFEGETSNVTDSPVDGKSAGSVIKAFIQQCIVNETNVLVDEQSAGAGTNIGNPVDEHSAGITNVPWNPVDQQSAGTMHGSGNPVDGQSAGLTEKNDAGTLLKGKVKGLDEDILKKFLADTIDAIVDQDESDVGCNTLQENNIDTGYTMHIRQFMRRMSLGIPVEEVDVTTFHSLSCMIRSQFSLWLNLRLLVFAACGTCFDI